MNDEIRPFNNAIDEIQEQVIEMGNLVNKALKKSIKLFLSGEHKDDKEISKIDLKIDKMDDTIHSSVLQLITIQTPLPEELRALTTMLRVSRELERIGDHAVNISESSEQVKASFQTRTMDLFKENIDLVLSMLQKSIEIFKEKDHEQTDLIEKKEIKVDQYYREIKQMIINEMGSHPEQIESLAQLFLVNRFLERSADHIVNISRQVKSSIY